MNAQEARSKAQAVNISAGSQFHRIIELIKNESAKGKYSLWVYESIGDDAKNKLQEYGYNVGKTQFDRNETLTEIKW